jgi:hypothetical protein
MDEFLLEYFTKLGISPILYAHILENLELICDNIDKTSFEKKMYENRIKTLENKALVAERLLNLFETVIEELAIAEICDTTSTE